MVRAPCCQKEGVKKGLWSPEEDQALIHYIDRHGHSNWRALPKLAGLLRCGKSCRLRWTNYLRPGIKRGNFTKEEEEAIITLHAQLGNKWSAIAAVLPGRTDNEIKNVWHTHLKKRSMISPTQSLPSKKLKMKNKGSDIAVNLQQPASASAAVSSSSSVHGGSDSGNNGVKDDSLISSGFDESFWSEALLNDDDSTELTKLASSEAREYDMEMEFWLNVFREAECFDN